MNVIKSEQVQENDLGFDIQVIFFDQEQEVDRLEFWISFDIYDYLIAKKLGRKMRALQYFLADERMIGRKYCDIVTSVKWPNHNDGYKYAMNLDNEYLEDDIRHNARRKAHKILLKQQWQTLKDMLESDIQEIGEKIRKRLTNLKPGYLQPIFNDNLPLTISNEDAQLVSETLTMANQRSLSYQAYKNFITNALTRMNMNPAWTCLNESRNGTFAIFRLDINGIGTNVHLQCLANNGVYNVFIM